MVQPVSKAAANLDDGQHVMMNKPGGARFALANGLEVSMIRTAITQNMKSRLGAEMRSRTVGAVALDIKRSMAAALPQRAHFSNRTARPGWGRPPLIGSRKHRARLIKSL